MKKNKNIIITSLLVVFLSLFVVNFALAGVPDDKYGIKATVNGTPIEGYAISGNEPEEIVGSTVQVILGFVSIGFFVIMLAGGITWMTAMGDTGKVEKAKDILFIGIIGFVLVVSSYAISTFFFQKLTANPVESTPTTTTP